ncbi:hypothetical protein AURDEDRAFT_149712 [Auricularia subglabra TFB-10046 SS5]|nr:hypothetical protein AURDEDRAFT_149712 [Auricularia subglabra TFB-10046 SS5]
MDTLDWLYEQETPPGASASSDGAVASSTLALNPAKYNAEMSAEAMDIRSFNDLCAEFLSIPEIADALANTPSSHDSACDESGATSTAATTPSLNAATPTTESTSVQTPENTEPDTTSHHSSEAQAVYLHLYAQIHQMGLPRAQDFVAFVPPPDYAERQFPLGGRTARRLRAASSAPHVRGRKRGREAEDTEERRTRQRIDDGVAGGSSHARAPEGGTANLEMDRAEEDHAILEIDSELLRATSSAGQRDDQLENGSFFVPVAAQGRDDATTLKAQDESGLAAPNNIEVSQHSLTQGRKRKGNSSRNKKRGGSIHRDRAPRATFRDSSVSRVMNRTPPLGADDQREAPAATAPVTVDVPTAPSRVSGRKKNQQQPSGGQVVISNSAWLLEPRSQSERISEDRGLSPGFGSASAYNGSRLGLEVQEAGAEPYQAGPGFQNTTAAAVGPHAQSNNRQKSRPARAIEAYSRSGDRRHEAIRQALVVLHQSATMPLPDARSEDVQAAVMANVQHRINTQTGGARSGPDRVDCKKCKDDYGVHERVLSNRLNQHDVDVHPPRACVLCGCPITRGGIKQYRRHRKANCPMWRVLVHLDRHEEWLDANAMIMPSGHRQFFADGVETRAPTRQSRLDELRAGEDVVEVRKLLAKGRLFEGIVRENVESRLQAEANS